MTDTLRIPRRTGRYRPRLHKCGLCFAPYATYAEAAACCTGHADGATADEVATVRERRRDLIARAADAGCPVHFLWMMTRPLEDHAEHAEP